VRVRNAAFSRNACRFFMTGVRLFHKNPVFVLINKDVVLINKDFVFKNKD